MLEAYRRNSQAEFFSNFMNNETTLDHILAGCMGNFVDWESGECHFETPAFLEFLEFCNTLPEGFEDISFYDALHDGRIFCQGTALWVPWDVAAERTWFGEDLVWPGYPVADGEKDLGGGVASPRGEAFSICKNSSNKEAAWDFLKGCLAEDAQREVTGIPLLRSVSEERIQEALTIEYETVDGREQEKIRHEIILSERGDTIGLTHITEADAAIYRSIIENTHRSSGSDPGMMAIIMEEAGVYFDGGKDAATIADIIQNRVSLYVGERMN